MLGHELRNPLGAVLTAAEVIDLATQDEPDRRPSPIVARQAAAIRRQGGLLTRLVDDLLDVARVTSGKVPLRKRPVDFAEIVRRCADSAARARRREGRCSSRSRVRRAAVWVNGRRRRAWSRSART